MPVKTLAAAILLFAAALMLFGCVSSKDVTSNDLVGEYVFSPTNSSPGKFADFLILKTDHTAVEIRFSKETSQVQIAETKWSLARTTGQIVAIANFSHPVKASGSEIRLIVNDDLGQYFEKVR